MFLTVLVRVSINSLVIAVIMGFVLLSTESSELTDSQCGIGSLGVNGLPRVSGLFVGVGVRNGLVGTYFGEGMGDPSGVFTGEGHGVSLGTGSGVNGCLGDQ